MFFCVCPSVFRTTETLNTCLWTMAPAADETGIIMD